ncbi:hypothetical protein IMX26_05565 [Clostridium sp. 'deep sea']|uniref:hypothetical protein n=1 Tax=Clostridium sp. 'deep sea' TaxID=2779445 RepID=UPI001896591F|nr:hypothetical protein [Clostridium sp. 'deep sea']QOR36281.1 hypothetical protein IMX26_05565 [Clostridium sp. 'deep sea']
MLFYKKEKLCNSKIYYKDKNIKTLNLVKQSFKNVTRELKISYNLVPPQNLKIFIMNSWQGFVYVSTPLFLWPFVGFHLMLLNRKMKKLWPAIGGWSKSYNDKYIIGIKDLTLMKHKNNYYSKDKESAIFYKKNGDNEVITHLVIHELITHSLNKYQYPQWLIEGLTLNTLETILNIQKVKHSTLETLKNYNEQSLQTEPLSNYIIGYWFVKYLNESNSQHIKEQLAGDSLSINGMLNYLSFAGFKAKVLEKYDNYRLGYEIF